MKLVHNLQNMALQSKNSIVDLLRNAYMIAFKLNLPDFKQWISNELNGYERIEFFSSLYLTKFFPQTQFIFSVAIL